MYVGRKYSAQLAVRQEMDFRCAACGYESRVWVSASGSGQGNAPYFLDGDGAAARAVESAEVDARDNLLETLALATCPKCAQRNTGAHVWSVVKSLLAGAALGACGLAMGWGATIPFAVSALVAAGLALGTLVVMQRKRLTVARRVLFPPVPGKPRVSVPAAALPAPAPAARAGDRDPFRSPPAAKPIEVEQVVRPAAPSPVAASTGEHVEGPKLLK